MRLEERQILARIKDRTVHDLTSIQGAPEGGVIPKERKEPINLTTVERARVKRAKSNEAIPASRSKRADTFSKDIKDKVSPLSPLSPPSRSTSDDNEEEEEEEGEEVAGEKFGDDLDATLYGTRLRTWGRRMNPALSETDLEDAMEAPLARQRLPSLLRSTDECVRVGEGGFLVPRPVWDQLLEYQREGLQWMLRLREQGVGGILGDEMGLGKTIQTIALMATLHVSEELNQPILIVCPATVMKQWVREIQAWWPPLRVVLLHSSSSTSGRICDDNAAMEGALSLVKERGHVLITSYGQLQTRLGELLIEQTSYSLVVLDEGHKIRNPMAGITERCKRLRTVHRLILSGTPIQNNLTELWSLMDFCYPGRLGSLTIFRTELAQPIAAGGYVHASSVQVQTAYRCACMLKDLISPFLLRRLKADVALSLPRKREQVLFCHLTDYQRALYEQYVASEDVQAIMSGTKNILAGIDVLRKICNHPALLRLNMGGEEEDNDDEDDRYTSRGDEGFPLRWSKNYGLVKARGLLSDIPRPRDSRELSGKMRVLDSVLEHWYGASGVTTRGEDDVKTRSAEKIATKATTSSLPASEGQPRHRVLLFCQTRQMLDIIESWLGEHHQEYTYVRMDGTTPISQRSLLVDRFNDDPDIFLFLLTTRVGGLGVNLTGADRVIIFDPDWNPSTDVQARERAWRLGQRRPVVIYRMLTVGTIEEKIYHRQIFKQYLTNRILSDPKQTRFFKSSDLYDLFTLGVEGGITLGSTNGDTSGSTSLSVSGLSETRALLEGLQDPHEEEDDEKTQAEADESYLPRKDTSRNVLEGLLNVSGLHSALEHDRLIEKPMQEVLLVEREAQRRATEALDAIKRSREQETARSTSRLPFVSLGAGLTTASILASIRKRQLADSTEKEVKVEGTDSLLQNTIDQLLRLFSQHRGRCTSELIARTFSYISGEDAVAFRMILKTMAALQQGQWVLKQEFS